MRQMKILMMLVLGALLAGCANRGDSGTENNGALVANTIADNHIGYNEYLAQNESLLHHDTYNSDVPVKFFHWVSIQRLHRAVKMF